MLSRLKLEEGWFILFLVWVLVTTVVAAILNTEIIDGLEVLPYISTLAIIAGVALAKSHFPSRTAHLMSFVYGAFLVTYLMGLNLPADLSWRERVFDLVNRQMTWLNEAFSQGSSRDGLMFVIHTSAVFWLLGYTAAWYTFRRQRIWRVILPSGLVLLSVIYYYYGPKPMAAFLAFYALVALVYVARAHLVSQERIWRSSAVRYETDIRFSFLQASFLAAVVTLGVAWSLPTAQANTSVNDALGRSGVMDTWRGFQDSWTRLFSSLRSYGGSVSDPYRETLTLGGPRTPGNLLIMDIYVEERIPFVYWQDSVYDTYEDGTWSVQANTDQELHFADDGRLDVAFSSARQDVVQTVVNYLPNASSIFGAPQVVNVDRQTYVTASEDAAGKAQVHKIQSRFVMRQGERYLVLSSISLADANSLRQAPQDYTEKMKEVYLQLPDTITPEVLALAEQLTAPYDNPFDKSIAVRDYLRSNIAYNDQIDAPPEGVEPVHYILFERQEAYCNYYASAMIMMLRSQGIPARFVSGYAQGDWDEETHSYRVRTYNAHAWVEVYFPGYGWIQFEPTASLPPGDRPETGGNPGDAFASTLPGEEERPPIEDLGSDEQDDFERLSDLLGVEDGTAPETNPSVANRIGVLPVVVAVSILGLAVLATVVAEQANRRVESSVEKSYTRIGSWARWLGILVRPNHTPYERANLLAVAVPEGKQPLRNLAYQYVRQRFSPEQAPESDFDPRLEWKTLRPLLLRRFIAQKIQGWRERRRSED